MYRLEKLLYPRKSRKPGLQIRQIETLVVHFFAAAFMRHAVSVRVSVTFVSCVKTNKLTFKIFSPSDSQAILVFPWQYSDGNSPNGGVECSWGRQKSRFWANIWLYCQLSTLRPRLGVVNTSPPNRDKLWHYRCIVSGVVCCSRETSTKCLWEEVSTLRQRQQNNI